METKLFMDSNELQECPCGLIGENCSDLAPGVDSFDDLLLETCNPEAFRRCIVVDSKPACLCSCGFKGELCDVLVEPSTLNIVLGILFGSIGCLAVVLYFWIRGGSREFKGLVKKHFVLPSIKLFGPKALLVYRFCSGFVW